MLEKKIPEPRLPTQPVMGSEDGFSSVKQVLQFPVQNRFRAFWDLGYRCLVPIVPFDAVLSGRSHLSKRKGDVRGKAPGVRGSDGEWFGLKNWQTLVPTEVDLARWQSMGAGVGLRLGLQHDGTYLNAVDADTTHKPSAAVILAEMNEAFPDAPVRIGRSPKALYLVRTRDALPYCNLNFGEGAVEVLTEGKQAVFEGIHPGTKEPYRITRPKQSPGRPPLPPLEKLPLYDAADLRALLKRLAEVLPAAMAVYAEGAGDRGDVVQERLKGKSEHVRLAMEAMPNRYPVDGYASWVKLAAALRGACQDDYALGQELFEDYSAKAGIAGEGGESPARVYRSLSPPFAVGASLIYEWAEERSGGKFDRSTIWWDEGAATAAAEAPPDSEGGGTTFKDIEPIDIFGDADPGDLAEPPPGSMPAVIEAWARDEAQRKGVPLAFAAVSAVAVVGAAIGSSLKIRPRLLDDGWTEPGALWVSLVAPPGSAKTAIIKAALEPLRKLDAERRRVDLIAQKAWEEDKPPKGTARRPEPKMRRFLVDDVTMEKQVRIHADNPRGVIRATDELMGLFASLGAYKRGGDGDRSQLLRLFDGEPILVDRVGSGTVSAEHALMSVLAGTQPDKLSTLVRDLGLDGMLQRFLFIVDDGQRRRGKDSLPDKGAAAAYADAIRTLALMEYRSSEPPIELFRGASEVLDEAQDWIQALADLPGASTVWQGHISKWGKFLPRLTLIFHALDHVAVFDSVLPGAKVERATAERAVLFARFLLRHVLRFYETYFGARAQATEARKIAGYLLTRPDLTRVARRDVYDARTNLRGPENLRALLAAMQELVNAGWIEPIDMDGQGPRAWVVNPVVRVRFAERAVREREERGRAQAQIKQAGAVKRRLKEQDGSSKGGD